MIVAHPGLFSYFFWHFLQIDPFGDMQINSFGDNLHNLSKPSLWENKKNIFICRLSEFLPTVKKCIYTRQII